MSTSTATGIVRQAGEGERRWFYGGGTHTWKVSAEETDGAFYVFEDCMSKGKMTPFHCHPTADELLYVLEGEIVVRFGDPDRDERVGAGGVAISPRGVPHAFMVTSETARLLAFQTPGSSEAFYKGASEPATNDGDGPVDVARVHAVAKETRTTQILGPPPFESGAK